MFTPLGLGHIVLRVRDQKASERFYREVLGCTLDHVNEWISLVQLRFGEQLIDLMPAEESAPAVSGGLDHFCLSIPVPAMFFSTLREQDRGATRTARCRPSRRRRRLPGSAA